MKQKNTQFLWVNSLKGKAVCTDEFFQFRQVHEPQHVALEQPGIHAKIKSPNSEKKPGTK